MSKILFKLSIANIRRAMAHYDDTPNGKGLNGNTFFTKSDIDQARTLNLFTDIYMFDVGFELDLHRLIAVLFNES